jgi:DNA mismatch endonuclease, patch repair protein
MVDRVSVETRSKIMSRIRSKNTKPEIRVRKFLFSKGFRYRLHVKKLPGSPDIVFPKYKTAIFVNGCFWHGHENCRIAHIPKTSTDFWETKIKKNQERDIRDINNLNEKGWRSLVIWECQLEENFTGVMENIESYITENSKPK